MRHCIKRKVLSKLEMIVLQEKETTTAVGETTSSAVTETTTEEMTFESIQEQVDRTTSLLTNTGNYIKGILPSLIMAVLILIIGAFAVKLASRIIKKAMSKSRADNAAKSFLLSLIRILLYIVVVIMALSALNVPMSSIITILGAAGLAISLALQNCLSNLCGGFIILFSKPFASVDTLEVDGSVGVDRSISILYTTIVTFDNKTVFIPNGKVSDAKIINYTETPTRRVDLKFDISYGADFEKAKELILGVIKKDSMILLDPKPTVRVTAHNESSVSIDTLVWVKNEDYLTVRYNMLEDVKRIFDENGIEIPFSQLDVHLMEKANERK